MIQALWRYPIKSLLGESLDRVDIDNRGVVGDRFYAITDEQGKFGSGKDTRRFRRIDGLFSLCAFTQQGNVWIRFPDNKTFRAQTALANLQLSHFLGQSVTVKPEEQTSHFDDSSIHILTTSSIRMLQKRISGVDVRRFRPNIVIDSEMFDPELVGNTIKIGDVILEITHQTVRCRMTTLAQGELKDNPEILKTLAKEFGANLGVYAKVINGGSISVEDEVVFL